MPSLRSLRRLLPILCFAACGTAALAQTTTFTGTVYSPLGPGTGDPIPNILVYVVNPLYPPPTFSQGVVLGPDGQNNCGLQPNLVPAQVLGSAESNYAGNFSFTVTGPLPTPTFTLVIQAGKWRRQYTYQTSSVTQGTTLNYPSLTMPPYSGTQADGSIADLPYVAVVTGSADSIECIFSQIGIGQNLPNGHAPEIGAPGSSAHIQLYPSNGATAVSNGATKEAALVGTEAALAKFDLVMFGCQGNSGDAYAATDANNLTNYVNSGGRIFGTHYEYIWMKDNTTFNPLANGWTDGGSPNGSAATVNTTNPTTFPEGVILGDWLAYIGALANQNPPPYIVDLTNVRNNTSSINAPAVAWATLNSDSVVMQFTFDTPLGAAGTPTISITYTNNTTAFQPGDPADSVTVDVTNNSTTTADDSLGLSITLPSGLEGTAADANTPGTIPGWTCTPTTGGNPSSTINCNRTTSMLSLAGAASDNVLVTFSIAGNVALGDSTIASSISGGGLSGSAQCGRVLYNDYHVEEPSGTISTSTVYPAECPNQSSLSNVQKFLEYSLYNLSSFIAATNTDVVDIQGTPTLAWTNPLTTIYYGTTPWVTSGQAATASYNGSTLSSSTGTFTYTLEPPAGAPTAITPTSVLPVGNNEQICATWAPTSATALDYTAVTTPACTTITVLPDTTATSVTPPSQIYYGQQFTITNPTVTTGGPASLNEGTLTYTITGTLGSPTVTTATICTLSPPSSGTCTSPLPTYYDAGTYTFQACYTDSTGNFANSCSGSYQVTVLPDPTTTTLTSTNDPAIVGSSVTFNAAMTTTYNTTPVGTANFYDGTALLASVTPLSNGTAAYTTSTLIVGPHSITVCYLPAVDPSGSYDFTPVPTCTSPFTQLVILAPSGPQGTVTLLNSSSNPSVFNSAVTFSAAVATTGAFSYIPSGSLTFYDGTTALAPATTLDANGYASLTTSALTVGTHSITAVYAGNTTTTPPFMASTSLPVSQVVTQALPSPGTGFLMQVNPTAISVGVGNTATVSVSITALNNFNQTVQLSCTGMPNESTCNFAQSLIPVGGGITTLTISPSAPHACGANPGFFVGSSGMGTTWPLLAASALGGLLLFRKRKRLGTRIAQGITLALALCVLTAVTGCGGNCTDFGTQPGTYTFTVTGTAGGTTPQVSTQTIQMVVHL